MAAVERSVGLVVYRCKISVLTGLSGMVYFDLRYTYYIILCTLSFYGLGLKESRLLSLSTTKWGDNTFGSVCLSMIALSCFVSNQGAYEASLAQLLILGPCSASIKLSPDSHLPVNMVKLSPGTHHLVIFNFRNKVMQ